MSHLYCSDNSCVVFCSSVIPAKAREYVFTGVGLCVCVSVRLSVCDHDN